MTGGTGVVLAGVILALSAPARPANTLDALGQSLTACFRAPEESTGSVLTVLLSLKRDGTVLGRPRVTYSHLVGSADAKRRFVEAALESLKDCTPVAVTLTLGAAIAGRPFSIRFIGGPAADAI